MAAPAHVSNIHLFTVGDTQYDLRKVVYWNYPTTTPVLDRTNVALAANGATASASSIFGLGYEASGAIDGDRAGNGWGAGGGWEDGTSGVFPDWLEVDFADTYNIVEVDVFTGQDDLAHPVDPTPTLAFTTHGITNFRVQAWDSGASAWYDIGEFKFNNLVWSKLTLSTPVLTSKIRIMVYGAADTHSRITEVEAWKNEVTSVTPGDDTIRVWFGTVSNTSPVLFNASDFNTALAASLAAAGG